MPDDKDQQLQERLAQMKIKNEELRRRHLEVEADKKKAAQNKALVSRTTVSNDNAMPAEKSELNSTRTKEEQKNVSQKSLNKDENPNSRQHNAADQKTHHRRDHLDSRRQNQQDSRNEDNQNRPNFRHQDNRDHYRQHDDRTFRNQDLQNRHRDHQNFRNDDRLDHRRHDNLDFRGNRDFRRQDNFRHENQNFRRQDLNQDTRQSDNRKQDSQDNFDGKRLDNQNFNRRHDNPNFRRQDQDQNNKRSGNQGTRHEEDCQNFGRQHNPDSSHSDNRQNFNKWPNDRQRLNQDFNRQTDFNDRRQNVAAKHQEGNNCRGKVYGEQRQDADDEKNCEQRHPKPTNIRGNYHEFRNLIPDGGNVKPGETQPRVETDVTLKIEFSSAGREVGVFPTDSYQTNRNPQRFRISNRPEGAYNQPVIPTAEKTLIVGVTEFDEPFKDIEEPFFHDDGDYIPSQPQPENIPYSPPVYKQQPTNVVTEGNQNAEFSRPSGNVVTEGNQNAEFSHSRQQNYANPNVNTFDVNVNPGQGQFGAPLEPRSPRPIRGFGYVEKKDANLSINPEYYGGGYFNPEQMQSGKNFAVDETLMQNDGRVLNPNAFNPDAVRNQFENLINLQSYSDNSYDWRRENEFFMQNQNAQTPNVLYFQSDNDAYYNRAEETVLTPGNDFHRASVENGDLYNQRIQQLVRLNENPFAENPFAENQANVRVFSDFNELQNPLIVNPMQFAVRNENASNEVLRVSSAHDVDNAWGKNEGAKRELGKRDDFNANKNFGAYSKPNRNFRNFKSEKNQSGFIQSRNFNPRDYSQKNYTELKPGCVKFQEPFRKPFVPKTRADGVDNKDFRFKNNRFEPPIKNFASTFIRNKVIQFRKEYENLMNANLVSEEKENFGEKAEAVKETNLQTDAKDNTENTKVLVNTTKDTQSLGNNAAKENALQKDQLNTKNTNVGRVNTTEDKARLKTKDGASTRVNTTEDKARLKTKDGASTRVNARSSLLGNKPPPLMKINPFLGNIRPQTRNAGYNTNTNTNTNAQSRALIAGNFNFQPQRKFIEGFQINAQTSTKRSLFRYSECNTLIADDKTFKLNHSNRRHSSNRSPFKRYQNHDKLKIGRNFKQKVFGDNKPADENDSVPENNDSEGSWEDFSDHDAFSDSTIKSAKSAASGRISRSNKSAFEAEDVRIKNGLSKEIDCRIKTETKPDKEVENKSECNLGEKSGDEEARINNKKSANEEPTLKESDNENSSLTNNSNKNSSEIKCENSEDEEFEDTEDWATDSSGC